MGSMGSTASPLDRLRRPPDWLGRRRHRLIIGPVAILAGTVAAGGGGAGGVDGIVIRLWLLLAIVVTAVLAVAHGFDRRYPTPSVGAVLLRTVSVGAMVALAAALVADPFVLGPADGGDSTDTALAGAALAAALAAAVWYGRRASASPRWRGQDRRTSAAAGPIAVGLVAVPTLLGHLFIAFFAAYCGGTVAGLLWLVAGLATPATLWLAERALHDRWPRAGVAVAVGRLVLVVLLQVGVLFVLTAASAGDAGCESTIGVDGDTAAAARISRAATGQ